MKEAKWTNEDTLKYNVTEFANMAEFLKYQNFDSEEEFNESVFEGWYMDLTPVKGETILGVLAEMVWEESFQMLVEQLNEDNPDDLIPLENTALIREYTEIYEVFHIQETGQWFADLD